MLVSWSLAAPVKRCCLQDGVGKKSRGRHCFQNMMMKWAFDPITIDHSHCPRLTYSNTISNEFYFLARFSTCKRLRLEWRHKVNILPQISCCNIVLKECRWEQQRISHSERGNEEEEEEDKSRLGLSGRVDLSSRAPSSFSSTVHSQPLSITWLRPKFMKL